MKSHLSRVRPLLSNPRIRGEIGWVGVQKLGEFFLQLITLKVLTNLLSQDAFGEFQLALTGLLLIANLLIMPMKNAYLRIFHQAEEAGAARQAATGALRWYALATGSVCVAGAALTWPMSKWLGLEPFTVLAAGVLFVGNQWRTLVVFVVNVQRRRRSATIQVVGCLVLQLGLAVLMVLMWDRLATAVIIAYAISTLFFALSFGVPVFRHLLREPGPGVVDLRSTVITFGIPFGLLLTFQWVQGFTDRYMLAAHLDKETAAVYIAAFQVCGVPFMLMWFFLEALLTPIMYQRAKDRDNPLQMWSAYRLFIGGVGLYLTIGALSVLGLWLGGQWLLVALTNETYTLPALTIVVLALARFAQCLTYLLDRMFTINQALVTSLVLRGAMALLTIPICWLFITQDGLRGAAMASMLLGTVHVAGMLLVPNGCLITILRARKQTMTLVQLHEG